MESRKNSKQHTTIFNTDDNKNKCFLNIKWSNDPKNTTFTSQE